MGIGLWIPGGAVTISSDAEPFTHLMQYQQGLRAWAGAFGRAGSSTRAETLALALAMHMPRPHARVGSTTTASSEVSAIPLLTQGLVPAPGDFRLMEMLGSISVTPSLAEALALSKCKRCQVTLALKTLLLGAYLVPTGRG